jgi:hypothetical protein
MNDLRITEILELADNEGFVLPLPAEMISDLEDAGYVIDLRTGEIVGTNNAWFPLVTQTADVGLAVQS